LGGEGGEPPSPPGLVKGANAVVERHDLLAEVDAELERALLDLRLTADRISALAELRGVVVAQTIGRRRAVTAEDLLDAAPDEVDRARILLLVRRLRGQLGTY
jgi:hypothetical protein